MKGQLPVLHQESNVNRHKEARDNERKRQEYNEKYDRRVHHSRKDDIQVGDHVLVRQNKLSPTFDPTPYVVTKRQNSRVTARNKTGHVVTRNISFFKRISKQTSIETDDDNERRTAMQNRVNRNGNNTEQVDEHRGLRRSQRVREKL